ncbi:hypothetical protein RIVM261_004920 [Rivularia sp. IAM M-261]|nr:hypothetical protein CAL7716_061590 [Calothrix sp. PCC 7716]GJD15536.1 hypothetical protein RIVM261_004920 [Rivularia sp. IAM M-261]
MKSSYTAPKLTVYGNVAEITQILGSSSRRDFIFLNGTASPDADASPDQGSRDVCLGRRDPAQPPANCDPRF